jgi:glycosyltransferase involved in cell wall biosynthesis
MAADRLSLPVVISERSDPCQQQLGTAWEWLRSRSYRRATTIVALTETAAQHLRSRFHVPIVVIPSAVDRPTFHSDRDVAAQAKRIVAIGRLEYEKGFDRLISAFAELPSGSQLPSAYQGWSLEILGEGSRRSDLERQVERLGLTGRVSMPGWIDPIWNHLATATFFVLPSRYEGFPSSLLEALAIGVPSMAVDCESGPRAIIDDPSMGLLVPNSPKGLRDGLRRLVEDSQYRETLGESGKRISDKFSWDSMADRYEALLLKAAAQDRPE